MERMIFNFYTLLCLIKYIFSFFPIQMYCLRVYKYLYVTVHTYTCIAQMCTGDKSKMEN